MTMEQLAAEIRSGHLSSRELTRACVERIEALDDADTLNCFLVNRSDQVVAEAAELDNKLANNGEPVGPLHGIPLGIKDVILTAGVRTTGGMDALGHWIPEQDATAVRLLKSAGALVLGKTNLHEAGMGITSNNPHYGAVRNPYDSSRIPGGSSGGSGAAVSAHLCPAAIGTDTGGSVRVPAALCGVVGLKPTLGRVGRGGVFRLSWSYDVLGPITRSVSDAATLLRVITAGPDALDPFAMNDPTGGSLPTRIDEAAARLQGVRLGVPDGYFADDNSPDVDRVLNNTYKLLTNAGVELVPVAVKDVELATPTGFLTAIPEAVVLIEQALLEAGVTGGLASALPRLGPDLQQALGGQVGPDAVPVPAYEYARALWETVPIIRHGLLSALSGVDALLTATTPATAVPLEQHVEMEHNGRTTNTFETFVRHTLCVSVAGLPAITVPGGLGSDGMPVGLQFIGAPWSEPRLLEIGLAYESLTTS
jgi:Asp-tRNA(Asn)/Glu-tRNA(Gln) amidotransferase A subunit family amidase